MAILQYNEITGKKIITLQGELFEVLESHVFRMQQRKPVNQTKLRNLITGKVTERSFHQQEKVEEAEINSRKVKYLYNNRGEWWFCEENNPSKRFSLDEKIVGQSGRFLKTNSVVELMTFENKIIGLRLPPKVELKVVSAPPAVKGNTAQGATKDIELENGMVVATPLFVNEGDTVVVSTQTGEYVSRAEKK